MRTEATEPQSLVAVPTAVDGSTSTVKASIVCTPVTTFTLFSKLPLELQNLIWQLVLSRPEIVSFHRNRSEFETEREMHKVIRTTTHPTLYYVCRNSRRELAKRDIGRSIDVIPPPPERYVRLIGGPKVLPRLRSLVPKSTTLYICKRVNKVDQNFSILAGYDNWYHDFIRINTIAISVDFDLPNPIVQGYTGRRAAPHSRITDEDVRFAIFPYVFQNVIITYGRQRPFTGSELDKVKEHFSQLEQHLEELTDLCKGYLKNQPNGYSWVLLGQWIPPNPDQSGGFENAIRSWQAPKVTLMSEEELMAMF